MRLQSARDVYYRFTLHYKKENLVVERNLGDFLFVIQTINKQKGASDLKGKAKEKFAEGLGIIEEALEEK